MANREDILTALAAGLNSFKADHENRAAKEARRRAAKAEDRKPWVEEDESEITRPSKPPRGRQEAPVRPGLRHVGEQLVQHLPRSAESDPLLDLLEAESVKNLESLRSFKSASKHVQALLQAKQAHKHSDSSHF